MIDWNYKSCQSVLLEEEPRKLVLESQSFSSFILFPSYFGYDDSTSAVKA